MLMVTLQFEQKNVRKDEHVSKIRTGFGQEKRTHSVKESWNRCTEVSLVSEQVKSKSNQWPHSTWNRWFQRDKTFLAPNRNELQRAMAVLCFPLLSPSRTSPARIVESTHRWQHSTHLRGWFCLDQPRGSQSAGPGQDAWADAGANLNLSLVRENWWSPPLSSLPNETWRFFFTSGWTWLLLSSISGLKKDHACWFDKSQFSLKRKPSSRFVIDLTLFPSCGHPQNPELSVDFSCNVDLIFTTSISNTDLVVHVGFPRARHVCILR